MISKSSERADRMHDRAVKTAEYIIDTKCTVRQAAKHFGTSKSLIHKDLTVTLLRIGEHTLYNKAHSVLEQNKNERHIRGGEATKKRWKRLSKDLNPLW